MRVLAIAFFGFICGWQFAILGLALFSPADGANQASWLEWIEKHEGLSGWLQAIFSVLAIAVAALIPHQVHKREQTAEHEERNLKARGIAAFVLPSLMELETRTKRASEVLSRLVEEGQEIQLVGHAQFRLIDVPVPPELSQNLQNLYLLGQEPGGYLLALVAVLEQYARMSTRIDDNTTYAARISPAALLGHIRLTHAAVPGTLSLVQSIVDGELRPWPLRSSS